MNIAIIGAGNVGGALARGAVKAGHTVTLTASHLDKAETVAAEAGGTAVGDAAAAARAADLIVLAVPYQALDDVTTQLRDAVAGKIVVDATNPLTPDMNGMVVTDRSGAEGVQAQLRQAKVVKAFNTVFANNQAEPTVDGTALDGYYAGDDAEAKAAVQQLLAAMGFRPVDVGPLAQALALEYMAFLNISLNVAGELRMQSGWKLVGPIG